MRLTKTNAGLSALIALLNIAVFVAFASAETPEAPAPVSGTYAIGACSDHEKWNFTSDIDPEIQRQFKQFITGKLSEVRGFGEGLAMRMISKNDESRALGEYWISRSLFEARLQHLAYRGFAMIAAQPVSRSTLGIQIASLICLGVIQDESPGLAIPQAVASRLGEYGQEIDRMGPKGPFYAAFSHVAYLTLLMQLNEGATSGEIQKTARWIRGSDPLTTFGKAIYFTSQGKDKEALEQLSKLVDPAQFVIAPVKKYEDPIRMMIARAHFRLGQFEQAQYHFKRIKKSSNELAHALEELSWAFLMDGKTREAIGTAINLQSGGLRKTFTPEGIMVMAMALNELCRYPESIEAIQNFKKTYRPTFEWLQKWSKNKVGLRNTYYSTAIGVLKGEKTTVPDKVLSEWLRSPYFIGGQENINLLYKEQGMALKLGKAGSKEQVQMAEKLLQEVRRFKPIYKQAMVKMKPGDRLPAHIQKGLADLRQNVLEYRHLRRAAPYWRRVLASHEGKLPQYKRWLVTKINVDLHRVTHKMYRDLIKVAENNHFIEVEIYSGATQDIIWQNAHPNYKEIAKELKQTETRRIASNVWNWGQSDVSLQGTEELWEDELGSYRADLYDNCSSKDKYLALKKLGGLSQN